MKRPITPLSEDLLLMEKLDEVIEKSTGIDHVKYRFCEIYRTMNRLKTWTFTVTILNSIAIIMLGLSLILK